MKTLIIIIIIIFFVWIFLRKSKKPTAKIEPKSNERTPIPPIPTHRSKTYYRNRRYKRYDNGRYFPSQNIESPKQDEAIQSLSAVNSVYSYELKKRQISCFYHMTHINNLSNIMVHGLLSHNEAHIKHFVNNDISDHQVNSRRIKIVPVHKLSLHNYVPLYINPRNPMLFARRNIQNDILILCFDASEIFNIEKVVYSDGNAAASSTRFFSSPSDFNKIDWDCLQKEYWNDYPDGKRKKCAEILVPYKIDSTLITKIICNNTITENKIKSLVGNQKIIIQIDNGQIYF